MKCRCTRRGGIASLARGFTLIEALIVVAIIFVLAALSIPLVQSTFAYFRLRGAVSSVTGAIQSTRYQAISNGYAYKVILNKAASTLQVQSDPTRTATFANVGNAIPLAGSAVPVVLGQDTTLMLRPSGIVQATTGSTTLTLTLGAKTETITISSYGNIKVTP
jgi:prepilin-type N-terminal cleavage/methylation domain-containing protein